ncbi:hypothetical protein [Burkholderia thailandensis]|uniref:hypothetical protein n=1 Tax=Burkholderia thailandensis TaxID=57975 RepID=UPI001184FA1A|nr:hypothetical protein [Burkholderia thailandensis]NBD05415.1 hypothetical protein [Burkholderia thailandensis]
MDGDNNGSQSGSGSLNVGVGDFRGATINVGPRGQPVFTPEQMAIRRHFALGGSSVKAETLSVFGVVTGIVSIVGLYFTLFQPFAQPQRSSWSTLFMFSFGLASISIVVALALRRRRFEPFLFRKYYLEAGTNDGIYLSSFTATCPWCGSKMHLRNVGPKEGPRHDRFICERNPRQHTINLDPTLLPEIDE